MTESIQNPEPEDASEPTGGFNTLKARFQERLEPYMIRFPRTTRFLKQALLGLVAIALLWVLQAIAKLMPSGAIQSGLLLGGLAALLVHKNLRKAIAATTLLFIFGNSVVYTLSNWKEIQSGQIGFDQAIKGIANQTLNNQVTEDITQTYTVQFEEVAHFPRRFISASKASERTGNYAVATGQFYRYISEVKGQDSAVRKLAISETDNCEAGERDCEIFHLLNYVSKEIKYVNDPRGVWDFIQSPTETLNLMAGDCEDQTILLASMLESIGIDSLIVFTEGHAYPMACTEEKIAPRSRYLSRSGALAYSFDRPENPYCYPLEPTDENTRIGQHYDYEQFILAVDPVTDAQYLLATEE